MIDGQRYETVTFKDDKEFLNQLANALADAHRIQVSNIVTALDTVEGGKVIQLSHELAIEISKKCRKLSEKLDRTFKER